MKSFNEWLKGRVISENDPDYQEPSFSRILGEDGDEPFSVEVDVDEGRWTVSGPLWSMEYVLNGSEPKAGNPVQEKQGVVFNTPGKRLENLPPALKMAASTWIDKEVLSAVEKYEKDDPRDYEDNPGREWDDEDQANYDRKLWQGGEDY